MIGLGHTLIPHVADSSFPSDHLTLWWAVAFSLCCSEAHEWLASLWRCWASHRLGAHLPGVHFPLDMLGAIAVAALRG
jgi:undecaprenyl-diphosphatase